jgi:hypothetical protein
MYVLQAEVTSTWQASLWRLLPQSSTSATWQCTGLAVLPLTHSSTVGTLMDPASPQAFSPGPPSTSLLQVQSARISSVVSWSRYLFRLTPELVGIALIPPPSQPAGHRGLLDVTFPYRTFCVTRERGENGARNDYAPTLALQLKEIGDSACMTITYLPTTPPAVTLR